MNSNSGASKTPYFIVVVITFPHSLIDFGVRVQNIFGDERQRLAVVDVGIELDFHRQTVVC